jgi:hypothetical protein
MKLKSSEVKVHVMKPGLLAWRWQEKFRGRGEASGPLQGQITWPNNNMIYI